MTTPWTCIADIPTVTTTTGRHFTGLEHCMLAYAVYKRFGFDKEAALAAWGRMMQSTPDEENFEILITFGATPWNQRVGAAESFERKRNKR